MSQRILYVDDEVDLLELAQAFFQDEGLAIDIASDPKEAMELLQKKRYDLIISDLRMPEMDGHELMRWARTEAKHTGKCVLVTGSAGDVKNPVYLAYDRLLLKPVDFEALLTVVRELL
jgi:CheY-like chemotaxis protein